MMPKLEYLGNAFRDIELSSFDVNGAPREILLRHGDDRRHGKPQESRFTRTIHKV